MPWARLNVDPCLLSWFLELPFFRKHHRSVSRIKKTKTKKLKFVCQFYFPQDMSSPGMSLLSYPQHNEVVGALLGPLCLSVHLSVRPTCRVRSVVYCLLHGLYNYSYVAQIQSMRDDVLCTISRSKVKAGLPSVTEFQYFVTEITLLLLKFSWNFGPNTEICLNFSVASAQKYWSLSKIRLKYWNYCSLLLKWVSRGW